MPRRIKRYAGPLDITTMLGPVWNADGDTSGGSGVGATGDGQGAGGDKKTGDGATGGEKPDPRDDTDWRSKFDGQVKVNRDLEGKLNQFRDGLKNALGIDDKKVGPADLLKAMQGQLDALTRDQTVNEVARRHKITDDDDLALLRASADKGAMEKLAARLAPKDGEQQQGASGKPGNPKPDPSQGRGSGGAQRATMSVSAGRDLWDELHPKK